LAQELVGLENVAADIVVKEFHPPLTPSADLNLTVTGYPCFNASDYPQYPVAQTLRNCEDDPAAFFEAALASPKVVAALSGAAHPSDPLPGDVLWRLRAGRGCRLWSAACTC
jgi:hypothetical protein